jgi:cytochrome c
MVIAGDVTKGRWFIERAEAIAMDRNRREWIGVVVSSLAMMLATHTACAGTAAAEQEVPLASSFPGPLWAVVAPKGGTASVENAHLTLTVPGGSNHDALLPSNQAVRAVQPIGNEDFDVSIKIDSPVVATAVGTSQGLMVLADEQNFITFALVTNGTNISLTAHKVSAGVAATVLDVASFNEYHNPMCLRLARAGNTYTAYYSADGVVWTQAVSFADNSVPTLIGPFAGNYSRTPANAVPVVMAINWFDAL